MPSATPATAPEVGQQQAQVDRQHRRQDLAIILFLGFATNVVAAIYQLFVPVTANAGSVNIRFLSGLVHQAGILLLFGILLRRQGRAFSDIGLSFHWKDPLRGLALAAGSWIYWYLSATFMALVYFWSGSQLHQRDPAVIFAGLWPALSLVYSMASAFYEEILVRGYFMTELIGLSCPVWLATVLSIALQTSYHFYYGFTNAILLSTGFAISAIYFARTRRLVPVILSHLFWNLLAGYFALHH
jgi:membrane protease YdiL (CAAX protease family)